MADRNKAELKEKQPKKACDHMESLRYDKDKVLVHSAGKGHLHCLKAAIQAGADVNRHDRYGSALPSAARNGHTKCVDTLLQAGANVNRLDKYYNSAMKYATSNGHGKCLNLLIQAGGYVDKQDSYD